jgi:hypothetical protein
MQTGVTLFFFYNSDLVRVTFEATENYLFGFTVTLIDDYCEDGGDMGQFLFTDRFL